MNTTATTPAQEMPLLDAERLQSDPRVVRAKQLLVEAINEHSAGIQQIQPPDPARAEAYRRTLEAFGQLRGGNLYFPYLSSGLGHGPFVQLADGSVKLDFITGIGVHGFGHSDPRIVEAGVDAAISDTLMQGNLQQGMETYDFVRLLVKVANESGAELDHCFVSSSGATANENALKIAFQKHAPAQRVLAFEHCFAGRTLALAALTDKASYRVGIPNVLDVDLLPFFDEQRPEESTRAAIQQMRHHLARFPKSHACLWMELIQGEGGYYTGSSEFFKALIKLAKDHHLAVVIDEVQTFARTTRPFAFQHFGLDGLVDIVTIGKITQACATLFRPEYKPQPGLISQTFTSSSFAMLAGQAILKGLIDGGHYGPHGRNQQLHQRFVERFEEISRGTGGYIRGPYGVGGMIAFTAGDGKMDTAKAFVNRLFAAGVMSFTAGANPTRVRFLVPLGSTELEHIDLACRLVEQVAREMSAS
jgi:acetylornithine aminotransferase